MRQSSSFRLLIVLFLASLSLPLSGQVTAPVQTDIKRVEVKKVCMIHNQAYKNDQIVVNADGRTYYAFCGMCKTQLANDPETRFAFDPVSGNKVDKAKAIIGVLPDNTVLYFESEKTFEKYKSPKR